jgi:hypothetical protein
MPANSAKGQELSMPQVYDRLGLTAAQQEPWRLFESRVDAYTNTYYRQKPVVPSSEDAVTHQIGRMVDNLQNRLAALEEVESAVKSLYASMTAEQQKTANDILLRVIPSFESAAPSNQPAKESQRKGGKPDGGTRSHRGGGGAGGNL